VSGRDGAEAWLVKDKKRNKGLVEETNAAIDSAGTGLKGLRNLGNTCFFNSIMQAFTHLLTLHSASSSN
jgi:ubiquitin C-terminal hydrolase